MKGLGREKNRREGEENKGERGEGVGGKRKTRWGKIYRRRKVKRN